MAVGLRAVVEGSPEVQASCATTTSEGAAPLAAAVVLVLGLLAAGAAWAQAGPACWAPWRQLEVLVRPACREAGLPLGSTLGDSRASPLGAAPQHLWHLGQLTADQHHLSWRGAPLPVGTKINLYYIKIPTFTSAPRTPENGPVPFDC